MASTLEQCILEIRSLQQHARSTGDTTRPRWPMIVLRSPKGWTGPKEVDGHKVEDFWRAHQVPVLDPATNKRSLKIVEDWMRSYKPEELFDANGTLIPELQELAPSGERRISANPHANGGLLRKELELPDFRDYAVKLKAPGSMYAPPTDVLAHFLAEVMRRNMNSFVSSARTRRPPTGSRRSTPLQRRHGSPNTSRKMPTAANSMSLDA